MHVFRSIQFGRYYLKLILKMHEYFASLFGSKPFRFFFRFIRILECSLWGLQFLCYKYFQNSIFSKNQKLFVSITPHFAFWVDVSCLIVVFYVSEERNFMYLSIIASYVLYNYRLWLLPFILWSK